MINVTVLFALNVPVNFMKKYKLLKMVLMPKKKASLIPRDEKNVELKCSFTASKVLIQSLYSFWQ